MGFIIYTEIEDTEIEYPEIEHTEIEYTETEEAFMHHSAYVQLILRNAECIISLNK